MPYFEIRTNIKMDGTRVKEVAKAASAMVSELLGKPERFIMVSIPHGVPMLFNGSDAPAAFVTLKSIGLLAEKCGGYSKRICEFLETSLNVSPDRVYIDFVDIKPEMFGWNSATF